MTDTTVATYQKNAGAGKANFRHVRHVFRLTTVHNVTNVVRAGKYSQFMFFPYSTFFLRRGDFRHVRHVAHPVDRRGTNDGELVCHHPDCEWHLDQYPWECTCGLTAPRPAWSDLEPITNPEATP